MLPTMNRDVPHKYRVTAPFRSPRYFHLRWIAHDYAIHIPESVTHHRDIHENGVTTGPWELLEDNRTTP